MRIDLNGRTALVTGSTQGMGHAIAAGLAAAGASVAVNGRDEWRRYFEVNVLSGVRLTRAYLPGMMERGWGRRPSAGSCGSTGRSRFCSG